MTPGAISARPKPASLLSDIPAAAAFIAAVQKEDGEIPWSTGGKTDPWDHVESAMGLDVAGYRRAAEAAYAWSARTQPADGCWWSEYRDGKPAKGAYKDPNMTAYIAVGAYHHYLVTGDDGFLYQMWDCVRRAADYVVGLQRPEGHIPWAQRADGSISERTLLTGCASMYLSLGAALKISERLGERMPRWTAARVRLGEAIRTKPHLFDPSKARFSMDWYYPVLSGAVTGEDAEKWIDRGWETFAVPGWGILCVSDRAWTTMAETAELSLTLAAMGRVSDAEKVLSWAADKKYADGAFWTGVTFPDGVIYTTEKTAWTGAAVLLAADLLYGLTPACRLFSHDFWKPAPILQTA
ncbi:MAG: phenyltransferase domain-containing protein [Desulfobacterales bacterium]|nr:phenyltransferase domain-containing protein [Desulfobacterales bacterium]MCF8081087.1 phenyltransferase domain-containing protein [Desulfobacterales bacterium]